MQMNKVVIAGYATKKSRNVETLPALQWHCPCRGEHPIRGMQPRRNEEHTNWHSLSFDGKPADIRPESSKKATKRVRWMGRIQQRQFTPRDGASRRTVTRFVVSQCHGLHPVQSANPKRIRPPERTPPMDRPVVGAEVENELSVAASWNRILGCRPSWEDQPARALWRWNAPALALRRGVGWVAG